MRAERETDAASISQDPPSYSGGGWNHRPLWEIPTMTHAEVPPAQPTEEFTEVPVKEEKQSAWVSLGAFLLMAVALLVTFAVVRQNSNADVWEYLTKEVLYFALAGWGVTRAFAGRWLTLKRTFILAGVFYVCGISFMLTAFRKGPALKAALELQSIGQQIGQIENRRYNSPQDYIDALLQVEPLVSRMRQTILVAQRDSSNPTSAQELQFQRAFSLISEGVAVKEQEVALAHEMQNVPPEKREQFFDSKLVPLFRQELEVQNRVRELQKQN